MQNSRIKQIVIFASVIVVAFILYGSMLLVQRVGKTPVEIQVAPSDSKVTVDGKQMHAGTIYVTPGKHEFVASRENFQDDKQSITVDKTKVTVRLLPAPSSQAAQDYLDKNRDEQQQREAIGGARSQAAGESLQDRNPIIAELPFPFNGPDDITAADFQIDYEETAESKTGVRILISAVDPKIRPAAIEQIKMWGYDPADLDIKFVDYKNPLTGEAK